MHITPGQIAGTALFALCIFFLVMYLLQKEED